MKFYTRSLRKVTFVPLKGTIMEQEVKMILFDEEGRPGLTSPASFFEKIRYIRDWLGKEPLIWPDDFTGQIIPDWDDYTFRKA